MSLTTILQIFTDVALPIFITFALGWLLDRRFRLHLETLVKLNIYLMVPAFIFSRVMETQLSGGDALKIVAFTLTMIALMFVCSLVAGRALKMHRDQQQSLALATMFYNSGNFGLPLVLLAFGKEAATVQVYVLATMNVSTFTVGLFLAQGAGDSPRRHWRALTAMLRQPTLYAVGTGAVCRLFDWRVQGIPWIWHPLELLSSGLVGFALITLGVQMSQTRHAPFRAPLLSAIGIRLVLAPLLAACLVHAFGFSPLASSSLILSAGVPTAINVALLAHEFGGDVAFATSAVYFTTMLSLLTTTGTLALLR